MRSRVRVKSENIKIIIFLIPVVLGTGAITCHHLYGINHSKAWAIIFDYPPESSLDGQQFQEMLSRLRGVGPIEGYYRAAGLLADLALLSVLMFSLLALTGKLSWKIVIVIVLDCIVSVFAYVASLVRY